MLLVVVPVLVLLVRAATMGLPAELREGPGSESIRFVDRDGRPLREVRADDATRARTVSLADVSDDLVHAVLAADGSSITRAWTRWRWSGRRGPT